MHLRVQMRLLQLFADGDPVPPEILRLASPVHLQTRATLRAEGFGSQDFIFAGNPEEFFGPLERTLRGNDHYVLPLLLVRKHELLLGDVLQCIWVVLSEIKHLRDFMDRLLMLTCRRSDRAEKEM